MLKCGFHCGLLGVPEYIAPSSFPVSWIYVFLIKKMFKLEDMVSVLVQIDLPVMNSRKKESFSSIQFRCCQTKVSLPIEDIQEKQVK